jgi:hypothetical protein
MRVEIVTRGEAHREHTSDERAKVLTEASIPGARALLVTCGRVLARAHAKVSGVSEMAGYLGSSDEFDEAMGRFAVAYADQTERDHAVLKAAVRRGTVEAFREG